VIALTDKTELSEQFESLKVEREELETEFNQILDSKVEEHAEAI
jgi:hypothetical protein